MFDFGADYMRLTTPEQRRRLSIAGNMAQELDRLRREPPVYAPMMEGCQMGAVLFNFQLAAPQFLPVLMFEANQYRTRFRAVIGDEKQSGLNGWQGWLIEASKQLQPVKWLEE